MNVMNRFFTIWSNHLFFLLEKKIKRRKTGVWSLHHRVTGEKSDNFKDGSFYYHCTLVEHNGIYILTGSPIKLDAALLVETSGGSTYI